VETVLKELEALDKPRIRVLNKVDLLPAAERGQKQNTEDIIYVSAKQGIGLTSLLDLTDKRLTEDALSRLRVCVPQSEGKTLALIEARTRVFSRRYRDGAVEIELQAPESVVRRLKQWVRG
jgi:GTP-binding protein HflX